MKSIKLSFFLMQFFLYVSCFSCKGFVEQPGFVSVFGGEVVPVKILEYKNDLNNEVKISFTNNVTKIRCSIEKQGSAGKDKEVFLCSQEVYEETGGSIVFKIVPEEKFKTGIGEPFFVTGSAEDKSGNSLDFSLAFTGANTNPAELRISELRPLYSSSPKSEFIELLVMKSGNLSGIRLTNVGSKKEPDYVFPAAEVRKGEFVVFHWRSLEEGIKDETRADIVSGGTQACANARDFWGAHNSLPKRAANVIFVEFDGQLQDAVVFVSSSAKETQWTDNLKEAAETAAASGLWVPDGEISNAVRFKITPSVSIGRKVITAKKACSAKNWFLYSSKNVTMGSKNRQ